MNDGTGIVEYDTFRMVAKRFDFLAQAILNIAKPLAMEEDDDDKDEIENNREQPK